MAVKITVNLPRLPEAVNFDDFSSITGQKLPALLKGMIFAAFRDEGRPGQKWQPVKVQSQRRRRDYGRHSKILTDTAKLRTSFTSESGPNTVTIRSFVPYAAAHQFGARIRIPAHKQWLRLGVIDGHTYFLRQKNIRHFDSIALGRNIKTGHSYRGAGLTYHKGGYWKEALIPAHTATLPKRPFLPCPMVPNEVDRVRNLVKEHLVRCLGGRK